MANGIHEKDDISLEIDIFLANTFITMLTKIICSGIEDKAKGKSKDILKFIKRHIEDLINE